MKAFFMILFWQPFFIRSLSLHYGGFFMRGYSDEIGILGAGAWGTALARHLCSKYHHARIWAYEKEVADDINNNHINSRFLPGIELPSTLTKPRRNYSI